MKSIPPSRYLVFASLAVLGCLIDLGTKSWIFERLGPPIPGQDNTWWIWQGVFGFQTSLNEGALFGIGEGNVGFFSLMSVVAAVAILVWLFVAGAARDWLVTIACGLIFAGILGNLYDRLGIPGLEWPYATEFHNLGDPVYAVRDWIHVMIGSWPWPTFNLADSMLVCGAGLICIHVVWFEDSSPARKSESAAGERSESGNRAS